MKIQSMIVSSVIMTILLIGVVIPIIDAQSDEDVPIDQWTYGRTIPIEGVTSASGALTLSDGVLHVTGIGQGKYTSNGVEHEVSCTKATLHVIVLSGQSQAVYRQANVSQTNKDLDQCAYGGAYYYGSSAQPVVWSSNWQSWDYSALGMQSMTTAEGKWRIGSMEAPVASQYLHMTGDSVYIVNTAINGRGIVSLAQEEGRQYSDNILTHALDAIPREYFNVVLDGWLWLHGQANKTMNPAEYSRIFGEIYAQYTQYGFKACVIEMPRGSEAPLIRDADHIIVNTYDNCMLSPDIGNKFTNDGPYIDDGTHYSQAGRDIVGAAMAETLADYLYPRAEYTSIVNTLTSLIPVLLAVSIVVGVAYTIISKRE